MKKILIFIMLAVGFLITPVALFAATGGDDPPGINIEQYFLTILALSGLVTAVTEFIKAAIVLKWPQVVSWVVAIILSFIGWLLHFGIFAGVAWWWIIIYGVAAGLVSNGIFDISIVKAILSLIPKKKE